MTVILHRLFSTPRYAEAHVFNLVIHSAFAVCIKIMKGAYTQWQFWNPFSTLF